MVRPTSRFPETPMGLAVAQTARLWGVTPSSLVGAPQGSLAALSLDRRLALRLLELDAARAARDDRDF